MAQKLPGSTCFVSLEISTCMHNQEAGMRKSVKMTSLSLNAVGGVTLVAQARDVEFTGKTAQCDACMNKTAGFK